MEADEKPRAARRGSFGSPLPEILYDQLRGDILSGVLEPGQILRQEVLARRCNVSRVPLREAMSRLEADGLVNLRPRRGYAVTSLDPSEIVEVFELRMVIEEHAATIAARARTAEDIAAVEQLLRQMEQLDVGNSADSRGFEQWCRYNYEFHARIIASTHRKRLAKIADNLSAAVERYIRVETSITGDVKAAEEEHEEIFQAFKAGDVKSLTILSRNHVESTAERLLQGLRRRKIHSRQSSPPVRNHPVQA